MKTQLGDQKSFPIAKFLAPFLVINIVSSLTLLLWPLATPIFAAEFCLLAIWSAWGPGKFQRRFLLCLAVGSCLFLSQLYLWIVVFAVASDGRVLLVLVQVVFAAWIVAQIPFWLLRYIWQYRITDQPENDLANFSIGNCLVGMTMICVALGSCRWSFAYLAREFEAKGFDPSFYFYIRSLVEFSLVVAIAGVATYLGFRLKRRSHQALPLFVVAGLFAIVSGWIWFGVPDRWFAIGFLWLGSTLFCLAIALPIHYLRNHGYGLYRRRKELGDCEDV